MVRKDQKQFTLDPATKKFMEAQRIISKHPVFAPLMDAVWVTRSEKELYPHDGYAIVTIDGTIHAHPKRHEETEIWVYVLAHCLLHLGFEHFQQKPRQDLWNIACDIYIAKFLDDFKLGKNPNNDSYIVRHLPIDTEEQLYKNFLENGLDSSLLGFSTGNSGASDMLFKRQRLCTSLNKIDWKNFSVSGYVML